MRRSVLVASVLLVWFAVLRANTGVAIEKAVVGGAGAVLFGFVAGELTWIAAPEFPGEEDPYRVSLPAALAAAYGAGVPFGAALGVHLAERAVGQASPLWTKWMGAELAVLAVGAGSCLLLETTDEPLPVATAYALPIAAGVGGSFAGAALAERLGWTHVQESPFRIGLDLFPRNRALSCQVKLSF